VVWRSRGTPRSARCIVLIGHRDEGFQDMASQLRDGDDEVTPGDRRTQLLMEGDDGKQLCDDYRIWPNPLHQQMWHKH